MESIVLRSENRTVKLGRVTVITGKRRKEALLSLYSSLAFLDKDVLTKLMKNVLRESSSLSKLCERALDAMEVREGPLSMIRSKRIDASERYLNLIATILIAKSLNKGIDKEEVNELVMEMLKDEAEVLEEGESVRIEFKRIPPLPLDLLNATLLEVLVKSFNKLVALSTSTEPLLESLDIGKDDIEEAMKESFKDFELSRVFELPVTVNFDGALYIKSFLKKIGEEGDLKNLSSVSIGFAFTIKGLKNNLILIIRPYVRVKDLGGGPVSLRALYEKIATEGRDLVREFVVKLFFRPEYGDYLRKIIEEATLKLMSASLENVCKKRYGIGNVKYMPSGRESLMKVLRHCADDEVWRAGAHFLSFSSLVKLNLCTLEKVPEFKSLDHYLIFIEDVEEGLSPEEQREVFDKLVEGNVKVVVSTVSPFIIEEAQRLRDKGVMLYDAEELLDN
ncbi:hypothetical protein IPA_07420 [Ignicoccus pacificus DSM 13166]|uniref:Uncharacterized protein n=1 Tax=Ignicoccus pacificus DSM 13166 TaxID=940294 RepID=A0A977KCM2_9CREN|nr:hypothetical protein IPA_07420 [Ignicoccus pacificus DSM 13166]